VNEKDSLCFNLIILIKFLKDFGAKIQQKQKSIGNVEKNERRFNKKTIITLGWEKRCQKRSVKKT
jgi:hypothetical protein